MGALELSLEKAICEDSEAGLRVISTGRVPRRAVRRAIEYIHANLSENIRLEDIAAAASLSAFHFSRTFRKATGMAPYRYLTLMRVERVKGLLRESEWSLATIAEDAGFSDQSHMTKIFKRFTGTTPKAFRDSWQTGLQ